MPIWERDVLVDRINEWLPRIINGGGDGSGTGSPDAAPVQAAGLPLADFGIHETLIDTSALATG